MFFSLNIFWFLFLFQLLLSVFSHLQSTDYLTSVVSIIKEHTSLSWTITIKDKTIRWKKSTTLDWTSNTNRRKQSQEKQKKQKIKGIITHKNPIKGNSKS